MREFIPFVTPRWESPDHLAPLLSVFERIKRGEPVRVLLSVPPQHGKAIADDTPMHTRRGWVRADDVAVGDELYAECGRFVSVTGVFPQGTVDLYAVSFSDDASLVTCAEHRWQVHQRYSGRAVVRTTAELSADLFEADGRAKWRIPVVSPVEGIDAALPIEPYLFGAWLGDGTSARGEITSADAEIVGHIRAVGFGTSYEYPAGRAKTYGVPGMWTTLRAMGVLRNKHIPELYLRARADYRLALLQGLADTDGTVAKDGSQQSICTTSERLADGIKTLIGSLGGTHTDIQRPAAAKTAHNIYFRLPHGMAGFRLARKQSRLAPPSARNVPRRFVRSVTPCGRGPARCFSVAGESRLYCAGRDYVVTHNTETELHGIAQLLYVHPTRTNAFAGYAAQFAESKSRLCRDYALRAGVKLRTDSASVQEWRTLEGGGLLATGVGGPLSGQGVDGLLIVDDPFKNRADAESQLIRDRVHDWFTSTAMSRAHPTTSALVVHTRWHPDDLIGRLERETDGNGAPVWESINLPAINDAGLPLWPAKRPLEFLEAARRRSEYDWYSMYMGAPRPRGGAVFSDVTYYDALPKTYRVGIGIDLAYTSKTHSDWCVAVVLAVDEAGNHYVLDVRREQSDPPTFCAQLRALKASYPGAQFWWYTSTTEKGMADLLREESGIPLFAQIAQADKFVRSQPAAAAWKAGRIMIPRAAPWVSAFVSEVCGFTGVQDRHDDQVDALAAAFDLLDRSNVVAFPRVGKTAFTPYGGNPFSPTGKVRW